MSLETTDENRIEAAVQARYSAAAKTLEPALCCPVEYDRALLEAIPAEVLERDYGCGDPSRWVRPGESVLDLGSGSGKICFLASQVVGPTGRVTGVDRNDEMLALARRAAQVVRERIGHGNVEFRRGRIQDLALDLDALDARLGAAPVSTLAGYERLQDEMATMRRDSPLVANDSIDVVLSNCVLNLVRPADKRLLFEEIHRVLRRGGRAVISDIVSDRDVPGHMTRDAELWSGCISGAFREDAFQKAFADAGFVGVSTLARADEPWRVVEGIEFRSVTVVAWKGEAGESAAAGPASASSCCPPSPKAGGCC